MNFVVAQHVDDFMTTPTLGNAKVVLEIPDKDKVDDVYTTVQSQSSSWSTDWTGQLVIKELAGNYLIESSDIGKILTYSYSAPITAYISQQINTTGFNTTISQLSSGTVTVLLSSYPTGRIISYCGLYETAGEGSTASIIRVSDNNFLLNGLLQ